MTLIPAINAYIAFKRAGGHRYRTQAQELLSFGRYIGDVRLEGFSPESILKFLDSKKGSRHTWRRKHSQLSRFFRYCHAAIGGPVVRMPAIRGMLRTQFVPHIYSKDDVRTMLHSAGERTHRPNATVSSDTFRMVLLMLYATGCRLSEVLSLEHHEFDPTQQNILLGGRTFKPRRLPIGPELNDELLHYLSTRPNTQPHAPLFARRTGEPLSEDSVRRLFLTLLTMTGVNRIDTNDQWKPRLFDFRATFAVHRIGQGLNQQKELDRLIPALSVYMGYKDLSATEKFLHLTPERFGSALQKLSPAEMPSTEPASTSKESAASN